ncbi:hypothetical protein BO71DRAFT_400682 [Aspergillus ellipticus CBS 707.79]|uniref:GOLD domain-containing protein n=1 Tax=Aspergillus ellipticus CBS 707.79 TaxID=1448320 RepID=A0A319D553_9EURO|nr:hypothetical protein BO71DRAFT_400682 [Aspergillus ellipticus CBS 707.79]
MNFLLFLLVGLLQVVSAARSGTYHCGWSPNDAWITTDADFLADTGIQQYRFSKQTGLHYYDYHIEIQVATTPGPIGGTYYFRDATDSYSLTAILPGYHEVAFDTTDPYIIDVHVVEG